MYPVMADFHFLLHCVITIHHCYSQTDRQTDALTDVMVVA